MDKTLYSHETEQNKRPEDIKLNIQTATNTLMSIHQFGFLKGSNRQLMLLTSSGHFMLLVDSNPLTNVEFENPNGTWILGVVSSESLAALLSPATE